MKSVGTVFDEPETDSVLKVWRRSLWGQELAQRELDMVRHLESIGLTPHVLDHGEGDDLVWIRYQRLVPLTEWLVGAEASDRVSMGQELCAQVQALHHAGVCHRDLQMNNVVLNHRRAPVFIDLEIAVWSDPTQPCFDLDGPTGDIEIPNVHHDIGLHDGVWWDAPWPRYDVFGATVEAPPPYLGAVFGPSQLYRTS